LLQRKQMKYQIINGNNIDVLKTFPDNHFDSVVTDPPYGIDFLGKSWDANTGALETYQQCLRVLKPGGHILAFSAARTYHHLAITLEQAGFEIRDQIMWIYSSGFPKSQDVGRSIQRSLGVKERGEKRGGAVTGNDVYDGGYKGGKDKGQFEPVVATDPEAVQWSGWGTALKPAHEPIALARKPIKGSIKDNVLKHGVGALNIDATRVGDEILEYVSNTEKGMYNGNGYAYGDNADKAYNEIPTTVQGRFPSNVLGEIPDYQKYFYCPKVSRKERHIGHEMPAPMFGDVQGCYGPDGERYAVGLDARTGVVGNNHPTVKPIELMKYLIKLVTPQGGRVLDPFNGSGSTGCAAVELGCEYVGIELDPKYVEIATKRIEAWNKEDTSFKELFA
jgi:16S rRNA G966 N2-methylase RsmD